MRGVVRCKELECQKPRCIFSENTHADIWSFRPRIRSHYSGDCQLAVGSSAPLACNMSSIASYMALTHVWCMWLAANGLADAQNSNIFICGMQSLDEDHPHHASFVCNYRMTCTTPVEIEYYTHKKSPTWE
mmetsp:Transcript_45085/g.116791  ORF Transcript_45085/g.116791 Transcript_45085/m.116791 type:complete len:131 (-) Transcript_45085:366-758(-)